MDDPTAAIEFSTDARTLELFERMRGGDSEVFGELYRRYHDELLFAVRAHLGPRLRTRLQSEDILQSVAADAFRGLKAIETDTPDALRRYLHAMVVNKIRGRADHFNAIKRDGELGLTPSAAADLAAGPEPSYHEPDRYERIERALAALPDDMREIIVLRKIDGLTGIEAAAKMERSEVAARKLFSRAMARLSTLAHGVDTGADGDAT